MHDWGSWLMNFLWGEQIFELTLFLEPHTHTHTSIYGCLSSAFTYFLQRRIL